MKKRVVYEGTGETRVKTSPERLAELEAMLAANPRIRRMDELAEIEEKRPLTAEENAEYEEIMRPIREMQALPDGFYD